MSVWRGIIALLAALFIVLILWAFQVASFSESFAAITADPWGIVSLADLYLGFILFGTVIFLVEEDRKRALAWIAPMLVLGNWVPALWLFARLPTLVEKLRR